MTTRIEEIREREQLAQRDQGYDVETMISDISYLLSEVERLENAIDQLHCDMSDGLESAVFKALRRTKDFLYEEVKQLQRDKEMLLRVARLENKAWSTGCDHGHSNRDPYLHCITCREERLAAITACRDAGLLKEGDE